MERLIRWLAPGVALRRQAARVQLDRLTQVRRNYQAASPTHVRVTPPPSLSGNAVMDHARGKLRDWGRTLDENHDMTCAALDILSQATAHQRLIPMLKSKAGQPLEDQSLALADAWGRWGKQCDATGMHTWRTLSMLIARTWFRDGEAFVVHHFNSGAHRGPVPYAITVLEPDFLPYDDFENRPGVPGARIIHGIEVDQNGRAIRYHFYDAHPGESLTELPTGKTRPLPAAAVSHIRTCTRLGQYRGSSVLAPAVTRIADLHEYEQSENFAAKVASSVCIAITRDPGFVDPDGKHERSGAIPFELQSGAVFDDLLPGEKVEVVDTSRPNPELGNHRKNMARAFTAGIGVSYSSTTHDYQGTYTQQRQDLVESRMRYRVPQGIFRDQVLESVYTNFVRANQLAAQAHRVDLRGVDPRSMFEFDLIPIEVPWIQPNHEAQADTEQIENRTESRQGIMRKRGIDPHRVDREIAADIMAGNPPPTRTPAREPDPQTENDDE